MSRTTLKLLREGHYAAEVSVALIDDPGGWGPCLSVADATKLDRVRQALRDGKLAEAGEDGRAFELLAIPA